MKRTLETKRGSVLIVVLWASVGLVSITLLFGHSMLMNYRGVDNDLAGRQADAAIEGAIRYAETLITEVDTPGTLPELTSYEAEALPVGEGEFWFLGRADDDINGTTREYALMDEAAKLNLNTIPTKFLERLPGMTPDLVSAIDEWRTTSNTSNPNSTIKGDRFESVEELALVTGMTRDVLYGDDANLNGVLDANEDDGDRSLPDDNADGKLDPGIYEYLTVLTKELPARADGNGDRILVSTLTQPGGMQPVIDMINEAYPGRTLNLIPGDYVSVLEFYLMGGVQTTLSTEEFDTLAANFASDDPVKPGERLLTGLVNVNTASRAVLLALLDDEATVENIISERLNHGTPSTGFAWAAQLITNPAQLRDGARYLTGQSHQIGADIAAVGRNGRGYRRTRVVLDTTEDTPKIVYRRNLSPLGWALGSETRLSLAMKKQYR